MLSWLQQFFGIRGSDPCGVLEYLGLDEEDFCRHLFFCGETGSGKTSAIRILLKAVLWLDAPIGAIHACVKADEAEGICRLVEDTPRADDLVRLKPGAFRFNVAAYELTREGGTPESLTRFLQRLNDQRNRSTGNDSEKSFWKNLFFDFMHYAITAAWLAYGDKITLEHIHKVIISAPASYEEAKADEFRKSFCYVTIVLAESNAKSDADKRAAYRVSDFFLKTQLGLGYEARSAGVQECCSVIAPFLLSPFYETFCSEESDYTPDVPLKQKYVVLDMPVLVYGPPAQLAQNLLISMSVDAALRQTDPESYTLVVRDEFHMLVSDPLYETLVHSVARSHGLSFWSAVQNLPLLTTAFGGDGKAETHMKALLANYATKFILANTCMDVTNRFFSTMFGQHKEQFQNFSENQQQVQDQQGMNSVWGPNNFNFGASTSYADRVPPDHFLRLRRGGPPDFVVDAYMAGRLFEDTGLPYRLVTFFQE